MRSIVTGGAGFIGSHVAEALVERGDDVFVVDDLSTGARENVPLGAELVEADIREPLVPLFGEIRPDACYHLAAQIDVRVSVERPDFDADVNVIGTIRVAEAARRSGTPTVFSSSGGAIYGDVERPAKESDERRPIAPYGTSKLAGEEYLSTYNRLYGTRYCSLRYANVYGPRQSPYGEAGVVAIFLGRLAEGERPTIYGDGRQTRDYVYVADVVEATLAALGHPGVFNVGTSIETPVVELYDLCRRVAGAEVEAEHAPERLGELQRSAVDVSLAASELNWRPRTNLDDGVRATWEWLSEPVPAERA